VIQFGLMFGVAATALTMLLGYLRASDGGYDELTLQRHRGWGIAGAALVAISTGLHGLILRHPARGGLVGFRVLLFTGFLCLAVAGHHGGSLTHGSGLLTENAPEMLRHLMPQPSAPGPGTSVGGGSGVGSAAMRVVLEQKCVGCHGMEKQKGKLRLDSREAAMTGGASGKPAIVPGDPGRSEVVRAILLPQSHDEFMPPDGKEPMSAEEVARLIQWIRDGAVY